MTDKVFNNQNTLSEDVLELFTTSTSATIEDLVDPFNLDQERAYISSSPEVMRVQPFENDRNIYQSLIASLEPLTTDELSNPPRFRKSSNVSEQTLKFESATPESIISFNQPSLTKPIAYETVVTGSTATITYKPILPELQGLVEGQDYGTQQVIVKFKSGIQTAQAQILQSTLGATTLKTTTLTGAQLWDVDNHSTEDAILALKNNPLVEYVEPNYRLSLAKTTPLATPNDPGYDRLWGLHNTGQTGGSLDSDIDAPEAWEIAQGDNVVVGVIDSGIDYTHPDLRNNLWTNPGEIANDGIDNDGNGYIDDYYGYDFVNNDSDPFDDQGHGTHVAGTIAAQANNNTGVIGVAPNAKVMALKFLGANGGGSTFDAIEAINYAVMMGADLTNNSWGGGGPSQALYDAIANAGSAGQLFVASAGNGGFDGIGDNNDFLPSYPASYDCKCLFP